MGAQIINKTGIAGRIFCCTNIPSVKNQPVMGVFHIFIGNSFNKAFFNFFRSIAFCKADFRTYSQKMRIHRHGMLTKNYI